MKVKHTLPKGRRVYSSSYKPQKDQTGFNERYHRIPFFTSLCCITYGENGGLWWNEKSKKWAYINESEPPYGSHCNNINSIKSALHHIRKHTEIPKGTKFYLCSPFVGCGVEITK